MSLPLKIHIVDHNVTKTIVFHPTTTAHDACRIIREKCVEADGQRKYHLLILFQKYEPYNTFKKIFIRKPFNVYVLYQTKITCIPEVEKITWITSNSDLKFNSF